MSSFGRLGPEDDFPYDLSVLNEADLHILNSRVSRQMEAEYLQVDGPQLETVSRVEELAAEFDRREAY